MVCSYVANLHNLLTFHLMSVVDIPLYGKLAMLPVVLKGGPAPGSLFSKLHLLNIISSRCYKSDYMNIYLAIVFWGLKLYIWALQGNTGTRNRT